MEYTGLKNKVAIITGAGEGIGFTIAELLLQSGGKVVINDVDEDKCKMAVARLSDIGQGEIFGFPGDAAQVSVIQDLVGTAIAQFGTLDFVVPNAGITLFGDFLTFTPADFDKVIALNLKGAFFLVQEATQAWKAHAKGGKVVLMSSQVGIRAYKNLAVYGMTKAALRMLAKQLAYELASYGVTINAIAPGATLTERTKEEEPDYEGVWGSLNPNGRVGTPMDMAKTCLFLLSGDAQHINGQTIIVDGGWDAAGKYPEDLL
jgi:3-oxoacyl-[acyl-carrier protein] reductase